MDDKFATTMILETSTSIDGPHLQARFLIQATFGPTLASIRAIGQMTFQQWIDEQMALPVQSHRAYWRKRANPYLSPRLACEDMFDIVQQDEFATSCKITYIYIHTHVRVFVIV